MQMMKTEAKIQQLHQVHLKPYVSGLNEEGLVHGRDMHEDTRQTSMEWKKEPNP
jgi:hypothetical protein